MKTCAACGKSKGDNSFRKDGRYKDNLSAICESCRHGKNLSDATAITKLLADVDERDRLELLERVFGALPTVDIEGVAILAAGGPYFGTGSPPEGDFFTKADLETIAEQTNTLAQAGELRPPSKLGHSEEQRLLENSGLPVGDELPAAGWLENFRVEKISGVWKLLADVKAVPAKLGQILASGGYRTRSVELSRVTSQVSGETYDGVVTGLAWLGAKAPAVRTLDDVWNLYAVGDVVWEEENGIMDLMSDLTAAINQEIAPDEPSYMWELWVNDINLELTQCTASDWDSDTTWIIGFTIDPTTKEPTVDARDQWVPSTMKLVQVAPEDADTLGGGSPMPADDDSYSAGARYAMRRHEALVKFRQRAADTTDVRDKAKTAKQLTDEQIAAFAATLNIEGTGDELRVKVEEELKSFSTPAPEPAPEPPAPNPPTPPAPGPSGIRLASFSEEQRAELTPLLESLTERAERGDRAFAQHFAEVRDGKIQRAMDEGRLLPAARDQWVAFYNAQPDLASKQLESLPVNPVLLIEFGRDEDGLTTEQAQTRDKAVEDAYLAATGAAMGGGDA